MQQELPFETSNEIVRRTGRAIKQSPMRAVDLFCGCGGLSTGFGDASNPISVDLAAGLDWHQGAIQSFASNHPHADAHCVDIRKSDTRKLARSFGKVDLVMGGPSCQGFSTHGKRIEDDPRNFLYKHYMKFVEDLQPKWVVMENVSGLLRYNQGAYRDQILADFKAMGYAVSFAQVQLADYGVPQRRKRVFFVANKEGIPFVFPRPTHGVPYPNQVPFNPSIDSSRLPHATVLSAIGDLPCIGLEADKASQPREYATQPFSTLQELLRDSKELSMHYGRIVPPENLERLRHIPPGGDWLDIPDRMRPERFKRVLKKDATTLYYRLKWDEPAYTITTVYRNVSSGAFTHPDEDRALSHREAARLQTFPDSYEFEGKSIPMQIGNAVPPLMGRVLNSAIAAHRECAHLLSKSTIREFEVAVNFAFRSLVSASMKTHGQTPLRRGTVFKARLDRKDQLHRACANFVARKLPLDQMAFFPYGEAVHGLLGIGGSPVHGQRLRALLRSRGVWSEFVEMLRATNKGDKQVRLHPRVALESWPVPNRKRPSRAPNRHFGTVLYELDPASLCTTMKNSI